MGRMYRLFVCYVTHTFRQSPKSFTL
jgi:hypothetical protein